MNYGEIGIILAVGALFYIGYQSATQTAVIGAVAKDKCAGLTGATLAACRKANPQGITPAKVVKKPLPIPSRFKNVSRPIRTPQVAKTPLTPAPRQNIIYNPQPSTTPQSSGGPDYRCQVVADFVYKTYLKSRKPVNMNTLNAKFKKMGYYDRDIKCGVEKATQHTKLARRDQTQVDEPSASPFARDTTPYGMESKDRPVQHITPIDHFVNSIGKALQDAWNNLMGGKTAIGGQPTILTASPSPGIAVRPMIAPIA